MNAVGTEQKCCCHVVPPGACPVGLPEDAQGAADLSRPALHSASYVDYKSSCDDFAFC